MAIFVISHRAPGLKHTGAGSEPIERLPKQSPFALNQSKGI